MIMFWHFCLLYEKFMFKTTLIAAVFVAASAASFAQTATPAVPAAAAKAAAAKADTKTADTMPAVKKSKNNICHDETSAGYKSTKNFTPFASMEECVKSGGRAPKGNTPAKK